MAADPPESGGPRARGAQPRRDGHGLAVAFQPIGDLRSGVVVGGEALARFAVDPPRPPNLWFDEAAAVGLGAEAATRPAVLADALQRAHATLTPERRAASASERAVLQAVGDGLSDTAIAARLEISVKTVTTHLASILDTLEVEARLQALVFALRHGAVAIR